MFLLLITSRTLVRKIIKIDFVVYLNSLALHHAAEVANYFAVRLLTETSAPIQAQNSSVSNRFKIFYNIFFFYMQGKTPYDLAVASQNKNIIEIITVEKRKRHPATILEFLTGNLVIILSGCIINVLFNRDFVGG